MTNSPPSVMLYAPASEPRKVEKACRLPTGAVILDLEDAVAPAQRPAARAWCASFLEHPTSGPERWVRINALSGFGWVDDLRAVGRPGLSGLIVPKVESSAQLAALDGALAVIEAERSLPAAGIGLIATIESPLGLSRIQSIATGPGRLVTLGFGAGDMSKLAGLEYPALEGGAAAVLDRTRVDLVLACSVARLHPPHDSVYGRYTDLEGLRQEATRARQMGFGGKHAIHPDQLAPLSECFSLGDAEIELAARIVEKYESAVACGLGAVGVDGMLVDEPIARQAQRTLNTAKGLNAHP